MALAMLPFSLTVLCAGWFMLQSPFTAPMVERNVEQINAVLTRAMAQQVSLQWLLPRVQEALLTQDLIALDMLLGIANDHDVLLPRPMLEDIAQLDADRSGIVARTTACGACAVDINSCETLSQIGACAVPFELTPAGDVNALRRAGQNYVNGVPVDQLDLGLAIVGIGATGAVLATGGTSYTIKAGSSIIRIAARLGTLTPALSARLGQLVADAVRWDLMSDLARGSIAPSAMVDTAKLAELSDIGRNLQKVATSTSVADTVSLLRHVDSAQDAARLAQITQALGPRSRGAFAVLGKTRVFRATVRISNLAIGASLAVYALALQILIFVTQRVGIGFLRMAIGRYA